VNSNRRKLLVIDVAALSYDLLDRTGQQQWGPLSFRPASAVFPAVTCAAQASFRTGTSPAEHGMVANGVYVRPLRKSMFWEQSAGLVGGRRIWQGLRDSGGTVAVLFWQQSLGEQADIVLSPAPIHKHHGGMIMDCYSQPACLYPQLKKSLGHFKLHHYWGPLARASVGDWIAEATAEVIGNRELAPDLCLTYLPTLDYDLQRHGPEGPKANKALAALRGQVDTLLEAADRNGYDVLVFGDYAIGPCEGEAVYPNRALRQAGLLAVRDVAGREYPDLYASDAFAMVDHEIAHVYAPDDAAAEAARHVLARLDGIEAVHDREAQAALGIDHLNSGQLVVVAKAGRWLAYPWWHTNGAAPDYAGSIDIHNKPGYDPCELFFGFPPPRVSQDTRRIRGSHGRIGSDRLVAWAATFDMSPEPLTLLELSAAVRDRLNGSEQRSRQE
jgi:predicted AlkP superfamily pyrophosphatase or phosphodiesterase